MKKKIRPEGPAKKIILLRFCLKKISWPGPKTQAPPEYQMDRALAFFHFDLKMHGVSIIVEASDIKCMLSVQL